MQWPLNYKNIYVTMFYIYNTQLGVNYMSKILTKSEAVDLYGNDHQKAHFNKYKRFNCKDVENALIKTVMQHFDSVERVKIGRSIVYKVSGEKMEISDRIDNRSSNGSHLRVPYSHEMDLAIIAYLEGLSANRDFEPKTVANWMSAIGVVTESMHDAYLSQFNDVVKRLHLQELIEESVLIQGEERIFDDYINFHETVKRNMGSSFARLLKSKIIKSKEFDYAVVKHFSPDRDVYSDGEMELIEEEHLEILASTSLMFKDTQRRLQSEMGLTYHDIKFNSKLKQKEIKKYYDRLNEESRFLLEPKYKGGYSVITNVYRKHSFFMRANAINVIKYIKSKILPFSENKETIQMMIEKYENEASRFNYDAILESFQTNKETALIHRAKQNEKKFLDYLEAENKKVEEENEFGGEYKSATDLHVNSPKNGNYYRSFIEGVYPNKIGGVDRYLKNNPLKFDIRLKDKSDKQEQNTELDLAFF